MKRFTLLFLLVLFAGATVAQQVTVTFNVDFKPFIGSTHDEGFDADNDSVYISGSLVEWPEPGTDMDAMMLDTDNDSVYTISVDVDPNASYQYKYFYVPAGMGSSWEYGDWDGDPNRTFEVGENDTTINGVFGGLETYFKVFDSQNDTAMQNVSINVADQMLTTDTEGWAVTHLLHDSTYAYDIIIDGGFKDVSDSISIARQKDTLETAAEPMFVTFNVNMKDFAAGTNDFDYGDDSVYVSGSMVGWAQPGTNMDALMTDADGDSIFTTKLQVDSGSYEYKYFFVNSGDGADWNNGEWAGGDNRALTVPNNSMSLNNTWGTNETMYEVTFMVTDTSANMLNNATVEMGTSTIQTNENGEASFGVPAGDYDYIVSKRGYYDSTSSVTVSKDTTISVELEPGTYTATFSITDMDSVAIEGASVVFADDTLETDASGEATMDVPAGEYEWKAMADTYVSDSGVAEIAVDTTISVKLALQTYTATFNVMDEGGNALEGASVDINDDTLTTNANGAASITLPVGSYDYTVFMEDYDDATGSITISDANVTEDVTLTLSMYTVTFTVMDEEDDSPVDGATVTIDTLSETTFGDGVVEFSLPNGDHSYTVTADNYADTSGTVSVDGAATSVDVYMRSTATAIDNPLAKQLRVFPNPSEGNITLQGENIRGAQVSVLNSIGKNVKQFMLNDNTNYLNLDELKPGVYFIKIENKKHEVVRKILIK